MNNKSVSSPISGGNVQPISRSSMIIVFALVILLALVAISLPRLMNSVETGAEASASSFYANPELKTLAYAAVRDSAVDLYANPELKVPTYAGLDKAAVQIVGGSEPRVLVFPEAMDNTFHTNPELKVLSYPADKAAVQIITGTEPRTLQFPEAMDNSHPEYASPELKFLNYAQPIE